MFPSHDQLKANYKRIISGLLDSMYEAEIPNALLLNGVLTEETISPSTSGGGQRLFEPLSNVGTINFDQLFELLQYQNQLKETSGNTTRTVLLAQAIRKINNQLNEASNVKVKRRILSTTPLNRPSVGALQEELGLGDGFSEKSGTIKRTLNTNDNLSDDRTPFN